MGQSPARRALLLLAALLAGGCYAPTLPLPPPVRPDISEQTETGTYRLSGTVMPNSLVIAFNTRTELAAGQETGEDGAYDFEIEAEPADVLHLWYVVGGDKSPPITFDIPED
jgi:hypothetical protein